MLTKHEMQSHYKNPLIKETIMRVSTDGVYSRAGMKVTPQAYQDKLTGEWVDSTDWYNLKPYSRKEDKKINLASGIDYIRAVSDCRTLYWTLNLFNKDIYDINYKLVPKMDKTAISRKHTVGYTLGVDIDKEHGKNIHDPEVKKAVEDMAQYFSDRLREYLPNSVYILYSGGGIYVLVHHKVLSKFYTQYLNNPDPEYSWDKMFSALGDAFDYLIGDMRDEFFKLHPEHKGKVKPDQLNNSQRVFKTIFSIHKSLDYAVVPLNPAKVEIDFERATLPLKDDVILEGCFWYMDYDDGEQFLEVMLNPYIEKALSNKAKHAAIESAFTCASTPIDNISAWAPCMRNIYQLPHCGEGATRALAAFASFLGQMNIEEEKAHSMFLELVNRWGARASNLFESYYKVMKVPTCENLNSNPNIGFPKGVSIKRLCVCKPDAKCLSIASPRYYSDKEANTQRLLYKLEKPSSGKIENKTPSIKLEKPIQKEVKTVTKTIYKHGEPVEVPADYLEDRCVSTPEDLKALENYFEEEKEKEHNSVLIDPTDPNSLYYGKSLKECFGAAFKSKGC